MINIGQLLKKFPDNVKYQESDNFLVIYHSLQNNIHSEVELDGLLYIYILNGHKTFHFKNNDVTLNASESALILPGNYAVTEITANATGFQCVLLYIDPDFFSDALLPLTSRDHAIKGGKLHTSDPDRAGLKKVGDLPNCFGRPYPPDGSMSNKLLSDLDAIVMGDDKFFRQYGPDLITILEQKNHYKSEILSLKIKELFFHILNSENKNILLSSLSGIKNKKIFNIQSYMIKHYMDTKTVEEHARATFRSLSSFKKEFFQTFGQSPASWIRKKRLTRAKLLLDTTGQDVTSVSLEVGYQSLSRFIEAFQTEFGVTPGSYRKKTKKDKIKTKEASIF